MKTCVNSFGFGRNRHKMACERYKRYQAGLAGLWSSLGIMGIMGIMGTMGTMRTIGTIWLLFWVQMISLISSNIPYQYLLKLNWAQLMPTMAGLRMLKQKTLECQLNSNINHITISHLQYPISPFGGYWRPQREKMPFAKHPLAIAARTSGTVKAAGGQSRNGTRDAVLVAMWCHVGKSVLIFASPQCSNLSSYQPRWCAGPGRLESGPWQSQIVFPTFVEESLNICNIHKLPVAWSMGTSEAMIGGRPSGVPRY